MMFFTKNLDKWQYDEIGWKPHNKCKKAPLKHTKPLQYVQNVSKLTFFYIQRRFAQKYWRFFIRFALEKYYL